MGDSAHIEWLSFWSNQRNLFLQKHRLAIVQAAVGTMNLIDGGVCTKVSYFFFPRKSLPSLTHSILDDFVFFFRVLFFFFRPDFFQFWAYFFFPKKSLKCTHSLKKSGLFFFFPAPGKKKRNFYSLTQNCPKSGKK